MKTTDDAKEILRRAFGISIYENLTDARVALSALAGIAMVEHPESANSLVAMIQEIPGADARLLDSMFTSLIYI